MGTTDDRGERSAGRAWLRCCPLYIIVLIAAGLVAAVIATTLKTKRMSHTLYEITPPDVHFNFTNVQGFFLQDDVRTDPAKFDFVCFINRASDHFTNLPHDATFDPQGSKTQWQRFENYVRHLNATAKDGESYKVIYLGRHGEGWHNVEEAKVGSHLWDCYWSRLDGDGNITWANAELTPLGVQQALKINSFWKAALNKSKIPPPEAYYVSPLQRTLATANYTFSGLSLPQGKEFKPTIKELLREALGVHTCDRRDKKSKIHNLWPSYTFEHEFSEDDLLWDPQYRESGYLHVRRLQLLLDDIFNTDKNAFISFTSHGGSISSLQQGIGHRQFALNTGGLIPIFLKAQKQEGSRPKGHTDPPTKNPTCPRPPGA